MGNKPAVHYASFVDGTEKQGFSKELVYYKLVSHLLIVTLTFKRKADLQSNTIQKLIHCSRDGKDLSKEYQMETS